MYETVIVPYAVKDDDDHAPNQSNVRGFESLLDLPRFSLFA